jgi:uncharacterized membrane protein HdeD (DUF308 family)
MSTSTLSKYWWVIALRGVFAVLFGVMAFIWPGLTLIALVLLFAVYAMVDGFLAVVAGLTHTRSNQRWWMLLLEGVVGIAAGVLTILWPDLTAIALVYLIGAWAIVTGVMEVVAAIRLRQEIENEWLLVLAGILSIGFGVAMVIWPGAGALTLVWLIGGYAVAFGVLLIVLSFRLRGQTKAADRGALRPV